MRLVTAGAEFEGCAGGAETDKGVEHRSQHDARDAECGDSEELDELRVRLPGKHRRDGGRDVQCGDRAHGATSWWVMARKASSRSAPATSRFWISTPRRKSSRRTSSGSLVRSRTR